MIETLLARHQNAARHHGVGRGQVAPAYRWRRSSGAWLPEAAHGCRAHERIRTRAPPISGAISMQALCWILTVTWPLPTPADSCSSPRATHSSRGFALRRAATGPSPRCAHPTFARFAAADADPSAPASGCAPESRSPRVAAANPPYSSAFGLSGASFKASSNSCAASGVISPAGAQAHGLAQAPARLRHSCRSRCA